MSVKDVDKVLKRSRLQEMLEREKQEKEAELERLKIERMVEEERKRLEELRKGGKAEEKPAPGLEELGLSMSTVRELAKLPEEERMNIVQTWAMLRSADKTQAGLLLPILIGYAKANPQASQSNLVEFAKSVTEQIRTGMELAKASKPEPTYDPVRIIETMTNIWAQQIQKPLEELVEKLQPQPSPFERILMEPELFQRAKEIGLFSPRIPEPQPSASPEIQLEIEKIRDERERFLEQLRTEREKWLAEFKAKTLAEERTWRTLENVMQGPLGRVVETLGSAAASKISGKQQPNPPMLIQCPMCGGTFYGPSEARRVICPHCDAVLMRASEAQQGGAELEQPARGESSGGQPNPPEGEAPK